MSFPFSSVYFRQKVRNLFLLSGKVKDLRFFWLLFFWGGGFGWTNGSFKMRGGLFREKAYHKMPRKGEETNWWMERFLFWADIRRERTPRRSTWFSQSKLHKKCIFFNFKVRDMVREYTVGEKYSPHKTCIAHSSFLVTNGGPATEAKRTYTRTS